MTKITKRVDFVEWFLKQPDKKRQFCFFSDEAYFYLTLPLNHQNNRIWSNSKPCVGVERPSNDQKILVNAKFPSIGFLKKDANY